MRTKLLLAAAAAALSAPASAINSISHWRNPVRGEGTIEGGYPGQRGELHCHRRIAAYKRQRAANRQRRKLLQA